MSSDLKQSHRATPVDTAGGSGNGPADFVAPEDLIGADLAAQLQEVLDEASANLADAPAVAPAATHAADVEPHGDSGTFESPAEVLAAESPLADPPPVAPAEPLLDEPAAVDAEPEGISFEEQLRELMALASGKEPAAPADAPPSTVQAAPITASAQAIDQTAAKAQAMTAELEQLNAMIQAAVTDGDAPAEARVESVKQLDEILAGHADHAVADEFETVNDVIALEKALAELKTETPAPAARFAAPQQEVAPADPGVRYGDDTQLGESSAGAAAAPAQPAPEPAAVPAPAAPTLTTPATAAAPAPQSAAVAPRAAALRDKLLRVCVALNRPLRNASESTRNLIGYAGLLTVANGMFLLLLKLLRG